MKVSYAKINNITCNECQRRIWYCLKGLVAKKNRPREQDGFSSAPWQSVLVFTHQEASTRPAVAFRCGIGGEWIRAELPEILAIVIACLRGGTWTDEQQCDDRRGMDEL